MTDFNTDSYREAELEAEFDRLFPQGFAGPDVLEELAPAGWKNSPLVAVFHPSLAQACEQALADAVKRIGLAERTGRGIDLIYQGLLRYGRPPANYGPSTPHTVTVVLPGGAADVGCCGPSSRKKNVWRVPCPLIR